MCKDQSIFPWEIISLTLRTFSFDYVLILFWENWCWKRKLNNCFMHQHDYMINEACKKYGELKRCVSQSADESSSSLLCALETSQKLHSLTMQSCFITISLQQFTSLCFHVSLILFEKILWYASMIRQKLTSELVHKRLFFFSQF